MTQRGHHDRVETMRLADGRTLGWRSYGDPGGVPVLAMHGSPDSAVVWRLADTAAGEAGARLIAPDRPGFGASTPDPGRSILDWVDDLDALTDHLGLTTYRLLAISGGSPYALATAWRRHWPFLARPLASAMVRSTRRNPGAAAERIIKLRPEADRAIIRRPDVMVVLMDNLPNQFNDPESIATEMRNAARPWGFDLAEVTVPTTIWQGGLDDVHPPAMGEYLDHHL